MEALEKAVWDELKTVFDPEIPVNIVDLGLVYSCAITPAEGGERVDIRMTLTAPGCPVSQQIKAEIEQKLSKIAGVVATSVEVVFDPPWNPSKMSEAAKLQLGLDFDSGSESGPQGFPILG